MLELGCHDPQRPSLLLRGVPRKTTVFGFLRHARNPTIFETPISSLKGRLPSRGFCKRQAERVRISNRDFHLDMGRETLNVVQPS